MESEIAVYESAFRVYIRQYMLRQGITHKESGILLFWNKLTSVPDV
jgi:hypothetical protein